MYNRKWVCKIPGPQMRGTGGTHLLCWAKIEKCNRRSFDSARLLRAPLRMTRLWKSRCLGAPLGMTLQWATGGFGCVIGSPAIDSFTR